MQVGIDDTKAMLASKAAGFPASKRGDAHGKSTTPSGVYDKVDIQSQDTTPANGQPPRTEKNSKMLENRAGDSLDFWKADSEVKGIGARPQKTPQNPDKAVMTAPYYLLRHYWSSVASLLG